MAEGDGVKFLVVDYLRVKLEIDLFFRVDNVSRDDCNGIG